jgi:hypothetical protein
VQRSDIIYTRFSSEMQRNESCEDQEREVRKGLELKGIDTAHFEVVNDRAASGTKNNRLQFDLLRERIQRGEINILAVDDQSRFSRADNAFSFITDLVYAGGRFISSGEGIDTKQEGWELRVKVMELHNSTTIRELGRRVRRGQLGRILDDGSAGDFPFGYESYYIDPDWAEASRRGPKPKKGVRIFEPEARWVRQVFIWFADEARSIGWIARQLTSLGVDKGHKATKPGWHHQQVHRMLCNPKYAGQWPWGTTRTIRSSEGKTKQVAVPAGQTIVRERPELRIIDQSVWERTQRRLLELTERFGVKPGQKPRGPRPHHTQVYPQSLLGGVLYCKSCGSRLWVQSGGNRSYLGCSNHRKGTCSMASRVLVPRAEDAILGFVSQLLSAWPGWLESAARVMRSTVNDYAAKIPEKVQGDRDRLVVLEKQINNLVDLLANGSKESAALRARLDQTELEAEQLRARIAGAQSAWLTNGAIPDDAWIVEKLRSLPPLLRSDPAQASLLLRRLLGRVTAEAIVAPGKSRGFIRLRFRVAGIRLLKEALGGLLPDEIVSAMNLEDAGGEQEFQIDLGEPTRLDRLAPEIAALREQGVPWAEIEARTGLKIGNAYDAWKRWVDAQAAEQAHPT